LSKAYSNYCSQYW